MKILFLLPYPLKEAPSQRFRLEQYLEILSNRGHHYEVQSFLNSQARILFPKPGGIGRKVGALLAGYGKRFLILFKLAPFHFIFIHREAAPLGPPLFEWFVANVLQKKIIYDFDDAIWMTDKQTENRLEKIIRWRGKVKSICRWSYKVSCGNHFLCQFASAFNSHVILNPTTIDTLHLHRREDYPNVKKSNAITLGWTGSYSTVKYLRLLEPVLKHLERKYPLLQFLVIADREPDFPLSSLIYRPWSTASEIQDLMVVDIGIMPLPDDEWSKGKCGFKALQYMALQIPTVASRVGVNAEIITDHVNGFLCSSEQEWIEKLELLINDRAVRERVGKQGRNTVEINYSVVSNTSNFLSLFE